MSNENCLYKLFPTIKDKTETIVAVGSDQGLDLFVNSQAKHLLMVDICPSTSSLSRSLLELGSIHKKIFGEYPTVEQYHTYFKEENVSHITRLLEDKFKASVNDRLGKMLSKDTYRPLPKYYEYLNYKSHLKNDNGKTFSWNSSDENLRKVFEAYDQGRIFILQRDLYSEETAEVISKIINSRQSSVDILYLSNSDQYLDDERFVTNTLKMPLTKKSIILRTDGGFGGDDTIRNEDFQESNPSLSFYPWHYTAISYEKYKEIIFKMTYLTFSELIRNNERAISQEPGVSFVGI